MNAIRSRAAKLSIDWKDVPATEKQHAQSFVRDLLGVYGITETRAAFYEKRVKRSSTGRDGYIDALIPGVLAIEMKSAGEDLGRSSSSFCPVTDGRQTYVGILPNRPDPVVHKGSHGVSRGASDLA